MPNRGQQLRTHCLVFPWPTKPRRPSYRSAMAVPNPQHAGVPPPAVVNRIQQVAIPVFANVVGRALAIDPQIIALYAGGLGIAAVLALTAGNNKTFWKVVSGSKCLPCLITSLRLMYIFSTDGDPPPPRWVGECL